MASIGNVTGSKFIGTPIVYPVTAAVLPEGSVFHRVRLVVTVNTVEFEFSLPVGNGEMVEFDISSALRAIADRYVYTAEGLNPTAGGYPYWTYDLDAYDDYLLNGEEHRGTNGSTLKGAGPVCEGRLTDRERISGERPDRYTRKPSSSPEIVHIGRTLIVAQEYSDDMSRLVREVNITKETAATARFYPIPAPRDSYEMRFINSLGVHESLHLTCLATSETSIQVDRHVIARQETLTRFSRGVALKHNDHERWLLSSGPLDRQWQQYYIHEVLMARWAWIKVDGQWLQVHILPEETVKGIDRQKASLLEVPLTVEFDITGSPFAG